LISFFTYDLNHDSDLVEELKIKARGKNIRVVRVTGAYIENWKTEDGGKGNDEEGYILIYLV
jgi:hypothetical protein